MESGFGRDLVVNLVPAILAGLIGGLGAYTAVKIDIAVLMTNQAKIQNDIGIIKDVSDRQIKMEAKHEFFQYQLDAMRGVDMITGL